MSEDIWAGWPSLFPSPSPLGPHFTIDVNHCGVQRFSYTFRDTLVRIEWCAVFVPADQRQSILKLHNKAALLLAGGTLGQRDTVATESKYLPIGWATMTCSSVPDRQSGELPVSLQQDEQQACTRKKYRLPYARVQAFALLPLVKGAAHWLGVAADALSGS
eukprot:955670-Pleurochrysis_carterae.AAC.1